MTMLHEAQRELHTLKSNIRRDNKKLDILRKLIDEYNEGARIGSAKLNELILQCLKDHAGHADFDKIADLLTEHYSFLSRQKISLALTKCPHAKYNRTKEVWELVENQ